MDFEDSTESNSDEAAESCRSISIHTTKQSDSSAGTASIVQSVASETVADCLSDAQEDSRSSLVISTNSRLSVSDRNGQSVGDEIADGASLDGDWSTTYEWPTIVDDSTTTDDEYTSTTSSSTGDDYEDSRTDYSETGSGGKETVLDSTSCEKSSSPLRTDDTDFVVQKLPNLQGFKPASLNPRRLKRMCTSPVFLSPPSRTVIGQSVPAISLNVPRIADSDYSSYQLPTLSSSWWSPGPKIRLGVSVAIRRRCSSRRKTTNWARRWPYLYHLRVMMSMASWKLPRGTMLDEADDTEMLETRA